MKLKIYSLIKLFTFIVLSSFITLGCNKYELDKQEDSINKVEERMKVEKVEAKTVALNFLSEQMHSSDKLRKTNNYAEEKDVVSIYEIKDNEDDVFMYFVNFKNKKSSQEGKDGFVVVAGDKRFIPILAYSDKGILSVDNLNIGQKIWIDYIKEVYKTIKHSKEYYSINEELWSRKSSFRIISCPEDPWGNPNCDNCPPEYNRSYGPYITTNWSQSQPYNAIVDNEPIFGCDSYYGGKSPAGCGPVAIALVWNIYGKPATIDYNCGGGPCPDTFQYPLDDSINGYTNLNIGLQVDKKRQIPVLLAYAGTGANTQYGFLGTCNSLTYRNNIKTAFQYAGYSNSGNRVSYANAINREALNVELRNGFVAIMDGAEAVISDTYHIWVVDGLHEIGINYGEGENCIQFGWTYYHMNWGWGNFYGENAWYAFDSLTPNLNYKSYDYDTALYFTYGMRK